MSKTIIGASIRLSDVDKSKLIKGKKGVYGDFVIHLNGGEPDKYGQNGFITQQASKEQRDAKEQMPILGNVRILFESGKPDAPKDERRIT